MTTKKPIKLIKKKKMIPFVGEKSFAVVNQNRTDSRRYMNFRHLHETQADAETEALRLAETSKGRFFVIEIKSVISYDEIK